MLDGTVAATLGLVTQKNRSISLSTPLDEDKLLLTSFTGSEHISDLYQFELEALSQDNTITPDQLMGKPVTVTLHEDVERTFNGYVNNFSFGELKSNGLRQYRMTIVPWLWFLSKSQDHRIFQNKAAIDIVAHVFDDLGFKDYRIQASGGTVVREYCVQYGETDLNFISRLLEEEGIAYYFEQKDDKHIMVIVDQKNAYQFCEEKEVTFSRGSQPDSQITRWDHLYKYITGNWEHTDYDFKNSSKKLNTQIKTHIKIPLVGNFEHYEYPGNYISTGDGSDYIKYRLEAEESNFNTVKAESSCTSFYAGGMFKLVNHNTKSEQGGYIITSIHHMATDTSYFSGDVGSSSDYRNSLVCIPDSVIFRPVRRHHKPKIYGPDSAVVTGPAGEEIYIDEYGRIKVQFFWDREGQNDDNTTCFMRVIQPWAGNQWGVSFIPRIGQEVIVNFMGGDPDRPIVSGAVYNNLHKPPYTSKTQSGIKTHSTKSGSKENFNELRFEDLKGSEQIFIHAEKNMDTEVENDQTVTVDHDRTKTIKHDEKTTVKNDRTRIVEHDEKITINNDRKKHVVNNENIEVGVNLTENVGTTYSHTSGEKIEFITGKSSITMTSDGTIVISGVDIDVIGNGEINAKAKNNIVMKGKKILEN